jgi:pyranose oxidase
MAQEVTTTSPHPIEKMDVDVLIVGSGPIGCAFARKLIEANRGWHVCMVDSGAQQSQRPGEHLKNAFVFQRNIDQFSPVIRGHLNTLSIPVDTRPMLTLDPGAFQPQQPFVRNGQNPDQDPRYNLPAAAATYNVGGMATHWTCACPRQHPTIERWNGISNWDELYDEAEAWLNVHPRKGHPDHPFAQSVRHQLVLGVLKNTFGELEGGASPQALPLACERRSDNPEFVRWSGADTVLGPVLDEPARFKGTLTILEQHRCRQFRTNAEGSAVEEAVIDDLWNWKTKIIKAKAYVLCGGAVLTPQVLFNSDIRPESLGCYLSEQPMAFCQIVLKQELLDNLENSPYLTDANAREKVAQYRKEHPDDPVPIPMTDPEPQVRIPVSERHPWHAQIHRDAFQYGDIGPNVDTRLIVDLRWFGICDQVVTNNVSFSPKTKDVFGMPQPTFHFDFSSVRERARLHDMMEQMVRAAVALGGFLSPSEPQFMTPGLTLHIHGTVRLGERHDTSVADKNGKVWGVENLYVGGNGVLPVPNACNPTLSALAIALHSANHILAKF